MKRFFLISALFFSLAFLGADELMVNLKDATDQVAQESLTVLGDGAFYIGAISFENKPVVLGDLFSDLIANRLLGNSRYRGTVVKGYSPGNFRLSDAQWVLSGSLYQMGTGYFLSLYLNDSQGRQKKGWEFLLPGEGTDTLLGLSKMAVMTGSDIYEPNDSTQTAVELNPDPQAQFDGLAIGEPGDEDWFYIDIDNAGTSTTMHILTAYTTGDMDTYMELYSPDDTSYPLAENDDGSDSNASISFALTRTGRWYIKVKGYSTEETGEYGLRVSLEMREAGPGEPDNSTSEASLLGIEGDELKRTMDYAEDYDYFRIELDSDLSGDRALVVQTYGDLDLTMTLLDEYENEVVTNDDSGSDGNPQVMIPGLERGVYYAVVYPYDGENRGSYSIRAYYMDVVRDDYENDDTMEEAGDIEVNGSAQVHTFMPAGEEDWVRIVISEPGEYIMKTTGPLDTYLSLYDRNGEFLYEDDDSGNDNNALISETLEKGTYYLQVTQYEGDGNIDDSYGLSVRRF